MVQQRRTEFSERTRIVVSRIPYGLVTTYGRIGRAIGAPRSARMVGLVLANLNPGHGLPAHRVVNHVGYLSGAEAWGDPRIMRDLLLSEGVQFCGEWQVDLSQCLWDPANEQDLDYLFVPPDACASAEDRTWLPGT